MNTDYTPISTPRSDVSMHRLSDSQSSVSTVPSTSETPRALGPVLYSYNSIVAAVDLAATTLFCLLKEDVEKHPQLASHLFFFILFNSSFLREQFPSAVDRKS